MYLFVLGRQPEISIAELRAVFGNAELVLPSIALVESNSAPDINRLGGVRKCGQVIYDESGQPDQFLLDKLSALPVGKITLGVSHYGRNVSAATANKVAKSLKTKLDRSVRVLPNSSAEIADAATLGNKLGSSPMKIELLMAYIGRRLVIAELTGVQDLDAYTLRDRGRPKRDARVGMLPPKLAQIMINLTIENCQNCFPETVRSYDEERTISPVTTGGNRVSREDNLTILDPFCGTGVVLQEAALMGFNVYGTDLEPRMIDYTEANLKWLEGRLHTKVKPKLAVGDATNFAWAKPIDLVVTETYLGQPYSTAPPSEKLQHNITTCNTIISKFLINLASQITPGTSLCVAVPCWWLNNKTYRLPFTHQLATFDYEQVYYSDSRKPLIYHREGQVVGRELLVLRRKP